VLGQQQQTGEALRWLSRFYWYSGNRAAGERCAAESLDVLTPLGPSAELAMAMSSQSQLLMLDGEHEGTDGASPLPPISTCPTSSPMR
jgi:hypothetical protein